MIVTLAFDNNGVPVPKKIVDTQGKVARVKLQVIGAATIYIDKSRDVILQQVNNLQQGLQLVQTDRIYSDWVVGELWAVGSVNNAVLAVVIEQMPDKSNPELMRVEGGDLPCGESLD